MGTTYGFDFSALSDRQVTDDRNFNIFPTVALNVHRARVLFMRFRPHRSDPEICHDDVRMSAHIPANPEFRRPFCMGTPDAELSGNGFT